MTGIPEANLASAMSGAAEHVRVSVVGGRTQLDVALPLDVPIATLVPELVKLVRSRDAEEPADAPWAAARDTIWVLSRLDPVVALQAEETLRAAGVVDGELLQLMDGRPPAAPTLYDDVVDAAARLNKAAYAGWNAVAARWMSFAGMGVASLVWVYFFALGPKRAIIMGLAAVLVAAMVGGASLAHRSYGQPDVGAAIGWCAIPIGAAFVWVLVRGFADYGVALGCAVLLVLNTCCYWAIGVGRWGYLASGVFFAASGLAVLGCALGARPQSTGVVLAVVAALACLTVPRLTDRLARVEPSTNKAATDAEAMMCATTPTPEPSATGSGGTGPSSAAMPTAEAVWARVRATAVTGSALYAGLAGSVLCGVAVAMPDRQETRWAALVFAGVCAAALGVHTRVPRTVLERASLGVPAVVLVVMGCVSAQGGTAVMAWVGLGTLLAVAAVASATGLKMAGGNRTHRWETAWAYLQYAAYAALIPVGLWAAGVYAQLEIR